MRKRHFLKNTHFNFQLFFEDCLVQSEKKCLEMDSALASGPRFFRGVSIRVPVVVSAFGFSPLARPGHLLANVIGRFFIWLLAFDGKAQSMRSATAVMATGVAYLA